MSKTGWPVITETPAIDNSDWTEQAHSILDGKQLREGDMVVVEWPDGRVTLTTVSLVGGTAHEKNDHNGVPYVIPLRGLSAQRVHK